MKLFGEKNQRVLIDVKGIFEIEKLEDKKYSGGDYKTKDKVGRDADASSTYKY